MKVFLRRTLRIDVFKHYQNNAGVETDFLAGGLLSDCCESQKKLTNVITAKG